MKTTQVDWNRYTETFPDRYIQPGPFDDLVTKTVDGLMAIHGHIDALDVGGGATGTQALKRLGVKTWLADNVIYKKPEWMSGTVTSIYSVFTPNPLEKKFHLAVARGSFNYLNTSQHISVMNLLHRGGMYIFNTFKTPRTGERRYTNSRTGQKGLERFFINGSKVQHQLIPDGQDTIIHHEFYIYGQDYIEKLFEGIAKVQYNEIGNSLHVVVVKGRD